MKKAYETSTLNVLSESIVFGQELLEEIVTNEKIELEQFVIVSLYRKLLEQLDGVFILADHNSKSALLNVIRASFETYLAILYILQKKKFIKDRATSYYIGFIKRYKEAAKFGLEYQTKGYPKEKIEIELKTADEILSNPAYTKIINEWERTKRKSNRNYEPKWYSLFKGPASVNQLIKELGKDSIANKLYGMLSTEAHAYGAIDEIINKDRSMFIKPLRGGENTTYEYMARTLFSTSTKQMVDNFFPSYEKKVIAFHKEIGVIPSQYSYSLVRVDQ